MQGGSEFYRICTHNLQLAVSNQQTGVRSQRRHYLGRILYHHHPRRTARGRFKTQRTATGKQVKTGQSFKILSEPVEQGFANPVRRRAQALRIGEVQKAPPPLSANDAYRVQNRT